MDNIINYLNNNAAGISVLIFIILMLLIILMFLIYLGYLIFRTVQYYKLNKENNLNKLFEEFIIGEVEFNFKIMKIKYGNKNHDKTLSWLSIFEILTTVVSNNFDEKGNCEQVLNSVYKLFQNIKKIALNNPKAHKSGKVSLVYLNRILRPFLAEWDFKINRKKDFLKQNNLSSTEITKNIEKLFRKDFERAFWELKKKTDQEKIIQHYSHYIGIKLETKKLVDMKNNI